MKKLFLTTLLMLSVIAGGISAKDTKTTPGAHKIKDVVIYADSMFYVAFPSVVKSGDEYLVAFRRAKNRVFFKEPFPTHTDENSYLVMLRSKDGENWTKNPELIYANPFGGSQDPCLLALRDGTLLCTSYGWMNLQENAIEKLVQPVFHEGNWVSTGGYLLRSHDNGKTWEGPITPIPVKDAVYKDPFGKPMPAYNRGALWEGKSGRIFWVVAAMDDYPLTKTSNHLIYSDDKGETWNYSGIVATHNKFIFNEASVYETPKGDIVAFIRTENPETRAVIARSTDGGKTFNWQPTGFYGHPLAATRLPDNRVFLTYGYREKPCGVRVRILNPECTDFATAEEIILRDDNGPGTDVGYSWPVVMDENHVLVVYYITREDGLRYIGGTIVEIDPLKK